ncbi:hypothetical protein BACERE00185_04529 [Bacillus mobilis]|uniref:Uncharacterized protein n=1 Tax=Bacillus mobilis TaxID=2026190 RepID=A0A1Y6AJB1_9BACI|nr:hypothetical protein BACERE00185_04529 [Bacillus mobilis]
MVTYGKPVEYSLVPLSFTLNFEEMAKTYDGIHLTENGLFEVRGVTSLFLNRKYTLKFYDVECTIWLKPAFEKYEELGHAKFQRKMSWKEYKNALSVNG